MFNLCALVLAPPIQSHPPRPLQCLGAVVVPAPGEVSVPGLLPLVPRATPLKGGLSLAGGPQQSFLQGHDAVLPCNLDDGQTRETSSRRECEPCLSRESEGESFHSPSRLMHFYEYGLRAVCRHKITLYNNIKLYTEAQK